MYVELTPYWIIYIFHKYEVLIPIKNYTDFRIDIALLIWRNDLRGAPPCLKLSLVQYLSFKTLSIKFEKELPPVQDCATFWVWYFMPDVLRQHSVNTGLSVVLGQEQHHQLNHTVTQSSIQHKYKHTNIKGIGTPFIFIISNMRG